MTKFSTYLIASLSILFLASCKEKTLFDSLSADQTGIKFANRITENDTLNILDFEYVYNGGGVGIGDFNNDGFADIYFTGNQVSNQLYLNKGNVNDASFRFEDVTKQAGVTGDGKWCSGVAVVDINNDGWLDLYVCATVKGTEKERANLLYINQGAKNGGVPTFQEMGAAYGVDDKGHSTNAAFFDYDNDGDLDLYVVTDKIPDDKKPNTYHVRTADGSDPTNDRLYRNDWNAQLKHPVFTNVSKEAGISLEGFGLGINICDINRDGWKDVYITNDYLTTDLLWVNNGNGTFTDRSSEYLKHTSHSAMGNDIADINNDGLADIIAVDMMPEDNFRKKMFLNPNNYQAYLNNDYYGYQYQYGRNTLQLNQGILSPFSHGKKAGAFSEIGMLSGIAETDWSWTPMVVDFDNDGFRDVIITNGFPKDITDHDFIMFLSEVSSVASKEMLLEQIPAVKIKNYAFRNKGDLTFTNVSDAWGIEQPSFSNGAAYADFDNDGDLDYVVNNINDSAFVFRNNLQSLENNDHNFLRIKFKGSEQNRNGLGAIVEVRYDSGKQQMYEHSPYRGYLSSVEPIAHLGLGKVRTLDEVKIIWQNGKCQTLKKVPVNQTLEVDIRNAKEDYRSIQNNESPLFADITDSLNIPYKQEELDYIDFNVQKLIPHKLSQFGPSLAVGDVNSDGLDDIFVGGSRQKKGIFLIQTPDARFQVQDLLPEKAGLTKPQEDAGSLLFDADGDGDLDLYVVSGGYETQQNLSAYQGRLYLNDGKGHYKKDSLALPNSVESGSCIKAADFDRDGDLDLFIGGRVKPSAYPQPVSSFVWRNDSKPGKPKFTDVTAQVAKDLKDIGLICDALWTDFDNDGWTDLLLSGEWMPLTFLKNDHGKFSKLATDQSKQGLWTGIAAGDFDNDGDIDYLVGNTGQNTLYRVSDKEPMRLYGKDFDNNGNYDAVPTVYYKDTTGKKQEFPFNVREDMIKQMITTRAKFPGFRAYAKATINELLTEAERKDAIVLTANHLQSSYVENLGNGKFNISALPIEAQFSTVFGMLADDFDQDGNLDVLLTGNDFGNELTQGRLDASNGLLLKGDGKGHFQSQRITQSGLCIPGDAKAVIKLTDAKGRYIVVASQNKNILKFFRSVKPTPITRLQPTDAAVQVKYANGKTRKEEVYYGSSFYSQAARTLVRTPQMKSVEVVDFKGNKRNL